MNNLLVHLLLGRHFYSLIFLEISAQTLIFLICYKQRNWCAYLQEVFRWWFFASYVLYQIRFCIQCISCNSLCVSSSINGEHKLYELAHFFFLSILYLSPPPPMLSSILFDYPWQDGKEKKISSRGKVLFRHSRFMVEVFLMANRDFI